MSKKKKFSSFKEQQSLTESWRKFLLNEIDLSDRDLPRFGVGLTPEQEEELQKYQSMKWNPNTRDGTDTKWVRDAQKRRGDPEGGPNTGQRKHHLATPMGAGNCDNEPPKCVGEKLPEQHPWNGMTVLVCNDAEIKAYVDIAVDCLDVTRDLQNLRNVRDMLQSMVGKYYIWRGGITPPLFDSSGFITRRDVGGEERKAYRIPSELIPAGYVSTVYEKFRRSYADDETGETFENEIADMMTGSGWANWFGSVETEAFGTPEDVESELQSIVEIMEILQSHQAPIDKAMLDLIKGAKTPEEGGGVQLGTGEYQNESKRKSGTRLVIKKKRNLLDNSSSKRIDEQQRELPSFKEKTKTGCPGAGAMASTYGNLPSQMWETTKALQVGARLKKLDELLVHELAIGFTPTGGIGHNKCPQLVEILDILKKIDNKFVSPEVSVFEFILQKYPTVWDFFYANGKPRSPAELNLFQRAGRGELNYGVGGTIKGSNRWEDQSLRHRFGTEKYSDVATYIEEAAAQLSQQGESYTSEHVRVEKNISACEGPTIWGANADCTPPEGVVFHGEDGEPIDLRNPQIQKIFDSYIRNIQKIFETEGEAKLDRLARQTGHDRTDINNLYATLFVEQSYIHDGPLFSYWVPGSKPHRKRGRTTSSDFSNYKADKLSKLVRDCEDGDQEACGKLDPTGDIYGQHARDDFQKKPVGVGTEIVYDDEGNKIGVKTGSLDPKFGAKTPKKEGKKMKNFRIVRKGNGYKLLENKNLLQEDDEEMTPNAVPTWYLKWDGNLVPGKKQIVPLLMAEKQEQVNAQFSNMDEAWRLVMINRGYNPYAPIVGKNGKKSFLKMPGRTKKGPYLQPRHWGNFLPAEEALTLMKAGGAKHPLNSMKPLIAADDSGVGAKLNNSNMTIENLIKELQTKYKNIGALFKLGEKHGKENIDFITDWAYTKDDPPAADVDTKEMDPVEEWKRFEGTKDDPSPISGECKATEKGFECTVESGGGGGGEGGKGDDSTDNASDEDPKKAEKEGEALNWYPKIAKMINAHPYKLKNHAVIKPYWYSVDAYAEELGLSPETPKKSRSGIASTKHWTQVKDEQPDWKISDDPVKRFDNYQELNDKISITLYAMHNATPPKEEPKEPAGPPQADEPKAGLDAAAEKERRDDEFCTKIAPNHEFCRARRDKKLDALKRRRQMGAALRKLQGQDQLPNKKKKVAVAPGDDTVEKPGDTPNWSASDEKEWKKLRQDNADKIAWKTIRKFKAQKQIGKLTAKHFAVIDNLLAQDTISLRVRDALNNLKIAPKEVNESEVKTALRDKIRKQLKEDEKYQHLFEDKSIEKEVVDTVIENLMKHEYFQTLALTSSKKKGTIVKEELDVDKYCGPGGKGEKTPYCIKRKQNDAIMKAGGDTCTPGGGHEDHDHCKSPKQTKKTQPTRQTGGTKKAGALGPGRGPDEEAKWGSLGHDRQTKALKNIGKAHFALGGARTKDGDQRLPEKYTTMSTNALMALSRKGDPHAERAVLKLHQLGWLPSKPAPRE